MMNRLRRISRNKKGEDMLVDFWAILLFVIILILFLIVFIFTKGDAEQNNKMRDAFTSKDVDYMLNSYIKSPYLLDSSKTIGEVISEDSLNNDFSRTGNSFTNFFNGINTSTNNDVGGYILIIIEDGNTIYKSINDLKNTDFEEKMLEATFMSSLTLPSGNIGVSIQLMRGNDPFPIKAMGSKIKIPRSDGKELEVVLYMIYVQEKLKIFE